jgi:hypothetical protein
VVVVVGSGSGVVGGGGGASGGGVRPRARALLTAAHKTAHTQKNTNTQTNNKTAKGARSVVRQALASVDDASRVAALAVSGQQHGLVALDAAGAVLRDCKLWCDTESAPEAAELSRALNFTLVPSMTATKLLWLKRHEPDVWARTAAVLLPHDYVNAWLTGRRCMEAGDASGTGVFDAARRAWDAGAMALVDARAASLFPEVCVFVALCCFCARISIVSSVRYLISLFSSPPPKSPPPSLSRARTHMHTQLRLPHRPPTRAADRPKRRGRHAAAGRRRRARPARRRRRRPRQRRQRDERARLGRLAVSE